MKPFPSAGGLGTRTNGMPKVLEVYYPYLLPSVGQRLTLDHFFVAKAQLLLLLCASLNRNSRGT